MRYFWILKKIIVGMILIYSFNSFGVLMNFVIPINFFTVLLVSIFDISAVFCLFLLYIFL